MASAPAFSARPIGLRPAEEFAEAQATWPRGDRPAAHPRRRERVPRAVQGAGPGPRGAHRRPRFGRLPGRVRLPRRRPGVNPYVQHPQPARRRRSSRASTASCKTLVWEPTLPEGSAGRPSTPSSSRATASSLSERVVSAGAHTVESALASRRPDAGGRRLRVLRPPARPGPAAADGDDAPPPGENEAREPLVPERDVRLPARARSTRFARSTRRSGPGTSRAGWTSVLEDRLLLVDGDVELGVGCALPGDARPHRRQPVAVRQHARRHLGHAPRTASRADNWHPHLSKIPGVRKLGRVLGREVVMNANTLEDSVDQYDSMIKEKAVADVNRADPRWHNVFPSSELVAVAAPVAGRPDLRVRRDELRPDREAGAVGQSTAALRALVSGCARPPRGSPRPSARRRRSSSASC